MKKNPTVTRDGIVYEYILSQAEYDETLRDQAKLYALEAHGVDNWCGYDDALEDSSQDEIQKTIEDSAGYTGHGLND